LVWKPACDYWPFCRIIQLSCATIFDNAERLNSTASPAGLLLT
jgi:hypothetical protein